LLDDLLRMTSGDKPKATAGQSFNKYVMLGISALMLIAILMVSLTLVLPQPASR
jgi:hypothetical protein